MMDPLRMLAFFQVPLEITRMSRDAYLQRFRRAIDFAKDVEQRLGTRRRRASPELQGMVAFVLQSAGLSFQKWNKKYVNVMQ